MGRNRRREWGNLGKESGVNISDPDEEIVYKDEKRQTRAHIFAGTVECQPTWYNLNEVGRPLPDVGSVVNYYYHGCIARKKPL